MRVRRFFACLIVFFTLVQSLSAHSTLLNSGDIRKVMGQLFEYHIDKKEMSPVLFERSLKIYITNFDPNSSYLLKEETLPYLLHNKHLVKSMMRDYEKDRFKTYFALNTTIQKSIQRARKWRKEWEQEPQKLVKEAKERTLENLADRPFAASLAELEKRHYTQFLKLIAFQMDQHRGSLPSGKEKKFIELCEKQLSLMENHYLGLDEEGKPMRAEEKEHHVILRTLKALAHSLDAHTAYYSPEEAFAMKVQLEKGMCGIGVILSEGIEGVSVREMVKGGPAEKGGLLQIGDTIVEIDGESVRHYSFRKVLDVLRGGEGTKTTLGILRQGENDEPELLRVELVRSKITIEDKRVDVSHEPFGDGVIGKITLHSFYEGEDGVSSEKDIRKAISDLREKGTLYGLVLDMRENSGGFLSQAVRVSGLFISSGVVVISKYSDGTIKYYRAVDGNRFYDGPLAILISRGSASATEIVAQTLQDYGVGVVVGDVQTYGKGTIQHQTVTSDRSHSFFKVTIGRYYTVSGKSTQIDGVKADIVVPTDLNFEDFGEAYLDFPLPPDQISPAFEDPLSDVDPYARKWFVKYYLPTVQSREEVWTERVSLLQSNSQHRLKTNKNFQLFLEKVREEEPTKVVPKIGSNDLQMEESVNIVKDMIFLQQK